MKRELAPSARADAEATQNNEAVRKADAIASAMREDFTRTFKTDHGKRVLAWLKQRSGFGEVILTANRQSQEFDPMATTFAAMELNLYVTIRKLLPYELITEIEDDRRIQPSGHTTNTNTDKPIQRVTRKRNSRTG